MKTSVDAMKASVDAMKASVDGTKGSVDAMKASVDGTKGSVDAMKTLVDGTKGSVDGDYSSGGPSTLSRSCNAPGSSWMNLSPTSNLAGASFGRRSIHTTSAV
jgi:hypothetical protein